MTSTGQTSDARRIRGRVWGPGRGASRAQSPSHKFTIPSYSLLIYSITIT